MARYPTPRPASLRSNSGEPWNKPASPEYALPTEIWREVVARRQRYAEVKGRLACFNSGQRIEDHFVDITEMVGIGSGAQRPVKTVMLSRYACYLIVQNADPSKEIVALGQTYFAVQTCRQGPCQPNSL